METLTENQFKKTRASFRRGWYLNIALVTFFLLLGSYFFAEYRAGEPEAAMANLAFSMATAIIASVLLMGAGISRCQARLEGQHLELKIALEEVSEQLDALQNRVSELKG
ncbi:MAG: hypothetical protein HY706_17785 [Candidatus Hydrogenedentes bacterium]|nr:hypothetical protein [Candidatus Hydrogenedentota bacterium]